MAGALLLALLAPVYYLSHMVPRAMSREQALEEIVFYNGLSAASASTWCAGLMLSVASAVPTFALLGPVTAGALHSTVLAWSAAEAAVSVLSEHWSAHLQFVSGAHYAEWRARAYGCLDLYERSERWNLAMLAAGVALTVAPALHVAARGPSSARAAALSFLALCAMDCYLVNLLAESRVATERAQSALRALMGECNWYMRPVLRKVLTYASVVYDRETGYILNSKRCNRYMEQIASGTVSMLDALTLSALRNVRKNVGFLYEDLSAMEKAWLLALLALSSAAVLLAARYRRPRGKPAERSSTL